MILRQSFLDDLKDHIQATPDEIFEERGVRKLDLLANKNLMDRLWAEYQKSVEEYDVDPDYAYRDALSEILNIQLEPESDPPMTGPSGWHVLFTDSNGLRRYLTADFPEQVPAAVAEAIAAGANKDDIMILNPSTIPVFTPEQFKSLWL